MWSEFSIWHDFYVNRHLRYTSLQVYFDTKKFLTKKHDIIHIMNE